MEILFCFLLIVLLIVAATMMNKLNKIEQEVGLIKERTPLVPYGTFHMQDVLHGICPSCNKTITKASSKDECEYCYQKLEWIKDIK